MRLWGCSQHFVLLWPMQTSYILLTDSSIVSLVLTVYTWFIFHIAIEFQSLLKGERVSHQQEEDEVMISGESSAQSSPPPPDSHLITAELEGSTLTRAQYNTICSLTSSLLRISTGDLVYDAHTLNPLTLHWHCTAFKTWFSFLTFYMEMAQEGIKNVHVTKGNHLIPIPYLSVSIKQS